MILPLEKWLWIWLLMRGGECPDVVVQPPAAPPPPGPPPPVPQSPPQPQGPAGAATSLPVNVPPPPPPPPPVWPATPPSTLPTFPGEGWEPDEPPPPEVVSAAWALLPKLWASGQPWSSGNPSGATLQLTGGRWIGYLAAWHDAARTVKGVTAFRPVGQQAPPTSTTARPPMTNAQIQQALNAAGFTYEGQPLVVDGNLGGPMTVAQIAAFKAGTLDIAAGLANNTLAHTRLAVLFFQLQHGLVGDSIPGPLTQAALRQVPGVTW